MRTYLIKRLLAIIPTLFFATLIVFCSIRLIPGDIIDLMISQHDLADQEVTRETISKALGLDKPIHVQYYEWLPLAERMYRKIAWRWGPVGSRPRDG